MRSLLPCFGGRGGTSEIEGSKVPLSLSLALDVAELSLGPSPPYPPFYALVSCDLYIRSLRRGGYCLTQAADTASSVGHLDVLFGTGKEQVSSSSPPRVSPSGTSLAPLVSSSPTD